MQKINVVTLGCAKNLVDSEILMRQAKANGFQIIHDSNDISARTVIINTCGFIRDAKQESIDTILDWVHAKENGDIDNLFVMGCLSERYKKDLQEEIPEVDQYFGVNDLRQIIEKLGGKYKQELVGERLLSTPGHYGYLKISEGCDRKCSFCAIPLIRGRQVSKSFEVLVAEAEFMASQGVKELILIAQDLTAYGMDLYKRQALSELLDQLVPIKGIAWIRLHYAYPANFPVDVLDRIREYDKICNYLDIPFQHIYDEVLKKMHRGISHDETVRLIDLIRDKVPGIAIRTTLLTGHPGESDQAFAGLKSFVQQQQFERVGVFNYSEEEDTFAANHFKDEIPEEVKLKRLEEIMEIQDDISLAGNQKLIGKHLKVLIDRQEGEFMIGRTEFDSPEIDQEVLVRSDKNLDTGSFYFVEITGAETHDIYGTIIGDR
ncbi:MAG: 30S ribosomal protein S12 methylthiotransferase RimO [Bacteroidales bacterium]|nr:30S ribosomal protein S12 methylthiotransferase RimO [Bacteroidales bacterium]